MCAAVALDSVAPMIAPAPVAESAVHPVTELFCEVISYDDFVRDDANAIARLKRSLYEKGIAGIRGIKGYREKVREYVRALRQFSAMPEEVKQRSKPASGDFLGYEKGAEKFQLQDGSWEVDKLKASYYALVPEHTRNIWPQEVDLKAPFQAIGDLMSKVGEAVMEKIGLLAPHTGIVLDETRVGRMLYYRTDVDDTAKDKLWCGEHFDHGLFTALLPAIYYINGEEAPEPKEAGLFVKMPHDEEYHKVVADDQDVMLFQVGEFSQLATNDKEVMATKHKVTRAKATAAESPIERYTMALFFAAQADRKICSTSVLAKDSRFGGGEECSYNDWHLRSLARYRAT